MREELRKCKYQQWNDDYFDKQSSQNHYIFWVEVYNIQRKENLLQMNLKCVKWGWNYKRQDLSRIGWEFGKDGLYLACVSQIEKSIIQTKSKQQRTLSTK